MATRSYIGIRKENQVEYVYCHHDGYIEGVGVVLFTHYNTQEKAQQLISGGDMSYVDKTIEEVKYYKENSMFCSYEEFLKYPFDKDLWDIEFFYLFDNGQWLVAINKNDFKSLREKLLDMKDLLMLDTKLLKKE